MNWGGMLGFVGALVLALSVLIAVGRTLGWTRPSSDWRTPSPSAVAPLPLVQAVTAIGRFGATGGVGDPFTRLAMGGSGGSYEIFLPKDGTMPGIGAFPAGDATTQLSFWLVTNTAANLDRNTEIRDTLATYYGYTQPPSRDVTTELAMYLDGVAA